jgi:phosphatidyl-myo-inositol dimannoside synthase
MQKEMKEIIILTIDFPPMGGGMSRHCYDLALSLKEQGEHPVILAPAEEDTAVHAGDGNVTVFRLKEVSSQNLFDNYLRSVWVYFSRSFTYVRKHRVKAVIANTWTIGGVAAFLVRMITGVPYYIFAHGLDVCAPRHSRKALWLMRLVLKHAKKVIANSDYTKSLIQDIVSQDKLTVVHPVIDTARFMNQGGREKDTPEQKIILSVGRLVKSKGQDTVIRALPSVLKQCPGALYEIVGNGPEESALKALAENLGVSSRVIFRKDVKDEDIPAFYRRCDVFIMMSRELKDDGQVEGFGIVFLEAAACGKPVIGSKSGGIPEALVDQKTGLLVEAEDIDGAAAALIRFLTDRSLSGRFGEEGRKRVFADFTRDMFGKKLARITNG